jgi:hypothetical protein
MTDNRVFSSNHDAHQAFDEDLEIIFKYIAERSKDEQEQEQLIYRAKIMPADYRAKLAKEIREVWAAEAKEHQSAEVIDIDEFRAEAEHAAESGVPASPAHADDGTYTIVENFVLDHPQCGGKEIAVYALLARRAHMPKRTCKASIVWLAKRTGWGRHTISNVLDTLIDIGALEKGDREDGGSYTWILPHRHRSKPKKTKGERSRYSKAS